MIANLTESTVPDFVWQNEAAIIKSHLSKSQPVSPWQSALLMQPFATGIVEVKIFHASLGVLTMHIGVPVDALDEHGELLNVPVVFRYYTDTHACAAVCDFFDLNKQGEAFNEDWSVMDKDRSEEHTSELQSRE